MYGKETIYFEYDANCITVREDEEEKSRFSSLLHYEK